MSTAAIKMKHYYETEGEETRRGELMGCNRNDKSVSVARGEREKRMREWHLTQLHEARARGLKHADYITSRESSGRHCIGPEWFPDKLTSHLFSIREQLPRRKKTPFYSCIFNHNHRIKSRSTVFFLFWSMLTYSRFLFTYFFLEEKPPWNQLRLAWWFAGLSWHPICTSSLTSWSVSKTTTKPANTLAWPDCETSKPFKISMANI